MELEDCAFPLLTSAIATDKPEEAFEGALTQVVLVSSLPRKDGQSPADLIQANRPRSPQGQGARRSTSAAGPTGQGADGP